MSELLITKFYVPQLRKSYIPRTQLLERLNAGMDRRLTLIAAPPGFGKTTLLSEWIHQSNHPVTWLSLDESDRDPAQFWTYFITSLQTLDPQLGGAALKLLQSTQSTPITSILTTLINEIGAFPAAFSMVLDDYHVIDLESVHTALTFLVTHMPSNMHLIITTRADPPLPLARMRARGQLVEIRAGDLRFTLEESAAFLSQVMGIDLSVEEVAALDARTEGWVAGLQIAALSMQGHADIPGFVRAFSGSHRHILGYLAEEVLDQRPRGTLEFMLRTSILDRMCADLCNALTGQSDGQAILESLEQANLLIVPLDDEGRWYRYHHLFAEVLQVRLHRNRPDLVPELHRRAGDWYERRGLIDEATRHAMAGGDLEGAVRLIETAAGNMLRRGASTTLAAWLDAMPEDTIRACPRLCLARGWAYFMGKDLDLEAADEWSRLAIQVAKVQESLDSGLTGEVAALHAMIAATRSEVERSIELARLALDDLPHDSPWRSAVAFCLGTAYYLAGDLAAAAPVFEEAIQLSQPNGAHFIQLAAASFLGEIQVYQGRLNCAEAIYEQVLTWSEAGPPQKGSVMAHAGLAHILCERNQLDAAYDHIQAGMEQLEQAGGAWSSFILYRELARIHVACENLAVALDALEQAYRSGHRAQVGLVTKQAAAMRACLQITQGDTKAAERWATTSELSPEDEQASHPGWREVEYVSLARVLFARGRRREALSLLDRLMQSAEVEERVGSAITILILKGLIMGDMGNEASAYICLERALTLAEPEGYVRVFLDEGEAMRSLLCGFRTQVQKQQSLTADSYPQNLLRYVISLLSMFPQAPKEAFSQPAELVEPVSERELEVLHLINDGLTNQEIADQLVIAVSTVKTHINHLYGKFGVRSRVQAVAIARDLGLT
jgi:LuxR family maltose regulon positive regulatory protein